MNKVSKIILLTICLLIFASVSFAQKTKAKSSSQSIKQTQVDLGKLRGNTYTNDYFELKIEFPMGWLVGDNTLESQLQAISQPQIKAKNSKNQSAINQAISRLTPLLGGYKYLPGSNEENSSLRISVENLQNNPQIKTNQDYMLALVNSFKIAKLPAGFTYSIAKNETIGKTSISYVDINMGQVKKRLYVSMRKRFALLITIEAYLEDDFYALYKVLQDSDLQYKK